MGCCTSTGASEGWSSGSASDCSINVNTDFVDDLIDLPGVGQKRAEAIVAHRKAHGKFTCLEDLLKVHGIGRGVVSQLEGLVSFDAGGKPSAPSPGPPPTPSGCQEALFFPGNYDQRLSRLVSVLDGAKKTLDVAVFAIGERELSSALLSAHKRGVKLRIITDDVKAGDSSSSVAKFQSAGIPLRMDSSERFHMHHKFVVADGKTVISGSLNWTYAGVKKSNENAIISRNSVMSREFSAEFERMWMAFGGGSVAAAPAGNFDGDIAVLCFPEKSGKNVSLIKAELELAKRSIDVAVFTLTSDLLVDVLIRKHKSGVRVRVITDDRQSKVTGADAERLRAAGVVVRMDNSWYAMHHKFAIIDKSTLINGSFNWTVQAAKGNQEDAVIFRNAGSLANDFSLEFERLWKAFELH